MANSWTKKNPLLSVFLSNANASSGRARGMWMQQVRRNQTVVLKQITSGWTSLWPPAAVTPKRKRRR